MLVHLPGAFRAAQIFGAAYETAPLGHQYAMELMAQAVERDISCRHRPVEETRLALESSRLWVASALSRHSFENLRLLPPGVSNFLQNRKASEILPPPAVISDSRLLSAVCFYQMAQASMRLAYFDELTGLRNRHELERLTPQFEAELLRKRKNTPGDFFLMVDIDFFKKVNDTYGHAAGDYFFRQGGEEFLAFLSNVGDKGIAKLAQKIRRQISDLEIPIPGEANPLKVTVSIGVARFRVLSHKDLEAPGLPKTPVARAIEEADEALYAAKERGRNRVVYHWKK